MPLPSAPDLPRSSLVIAAFGGLALALSGCGAATPAATTPAHGEVEVVVPKSEAPPPAARAKDANDEEDPDDGVARLSAMGTLKSIDEEQLLKLLEGTGSGGVVGGVVGGILGGSSSGLGGLGLSGSGIGGGGTGIGLGGFGSGGGGGTIGLGSIGTIGRGSGSGYGSSGGYRSDPVSGTSIDVSGRSIIDFGDTSTLGVSPEQSVRALRGRAHELHVCYEEKGLAVSASATGSMSLRLVIGSDGYTKYAASVAPFLPNKEVVTCVTNKLTKVYVGPPPAGSFAVIETVISFRPKK